MNKDNAKDYLPLVQALADGKTIQGSINPKKYGWRDYASYEEMNFNAPIEQYRIKPEPIEKWVCMWDDNTFFDRLYDSKEECEERHNDDNAWGKAIKLVEVTE